MELGSEPPPRARRRCLDGDGDGDGVDRISGLPDDLFFHVLVRLRCARTAARTSLLSRRWRGRWALLPELTFREMAPGALHDALVQVARPELSLLHIDVPEPHWLSTADVTSLLRTAARLAPVELIFIVAVSIYNQDIAVEVPCFHRATSIKLHLRDDFDETLPLQAGEFPVLERLSIAGFQFNTADLILLCPPLRVLEVCGCERLNIFKVHSTTIQELIVDRNGFLGGIGIIAPVLKKFAFSNIMEDDFSISFSAPLVENISWSCWF